MFRITVEVTKGGAIEVTSLVVKATKDTSFFNELVRGGLFDREIEVFTKILPSVHRLLNDASPGKYQPFAANFFYALSGLPSCLVMEDLKARGFEMAERTVGLDLNHCLLVMRQIG
ncbi:hypothetical protein L798_12714 [Zootermopsis nevadensis]|uniref:Uncharacterized protein n=1 Tax=Zootermopsis nevadensis TaxID=136037 RepID=A0A067RPN3_ZOONE|nr:hypothetical protein L798_12714 [Zootermopsis nevadensis]